ncbi:hypothetical protein EON81_22465 [bacterium]|nr:MAG: hypothetical protein EON81_22465 [bacterium]
MRGEEEFYDGPEEGWSEEIGTTIRQAEAIAPGWASCSGLPLESLTLQAGKSRDGDLMLSLMGRGGIPRAVVDRTAATRLFDPLSDGCEELILGLILDRHDAGIRVTFKGVVLGKVDTHQLAVAWGIRPLVQGRPKPFRGYS